MTPAWAVPLGLVAAAALLGMSVGMLVHRSLALCAPLAKRTKGAWDDVLAEGLSPGLPVILLAAGFWAAIRHSEALLPPGLVRASTTLAFVLAAWGVANLASRILRAMMDERVARQPRTRVLAAVARPVVSGLAYTLAALVVMGSLGVEITPILASLGIGGLAVALALQDSLSNFFTGLWMRASKDVRPGHYVRLEARRLEGHVLAIGWRTTRLKTPGDDYVIVPNAVLAQEVVTNFHLPDPRTALSLSVTVERSEDAERVAALLEEEARAAADEVSGILAEPPPQARLIPGFVPAGIEYTLTVRIRNIVDGAQAQDALRRRILKRFKADGVRLAGWPAVIPVSPAPNLPPPPPPPA